MTVLINPKFPYSFLLLLLEDKKMRTEPEANMSWFQGTTPLSSRSLSILLEKFVPVPFPADMIPRLRKTTSMKRSRCTIWGFYHRESDWIPQNTDEPLFSWSNRGIFSKAGPVIRNPPRFTSDVYAWVKCEHEQICV